MSISADQLVICKGIGLLQFFMAEAPGRFLFGIEKGQMLLEFSVHGWVVKGHTGVRLPFQRFVAHIIDVLTARPQHDDDRFLFFSVWMKPHANTPFSVFFDPVSAFVLLSEQCADPGCKQRREGQRQDLLELLFPVIAKAVVPGAAFCLRDIVLEKPGLRDQNVIQPDDVEGFNAEKNYKEADQKLSEGEALLYPVPSPVNDHADKAQHTEHQDDPADHRRGRERRLMLPGFFFDIIWEKC